MKLSKKSLALAGGLVLVAGTCWAGHHWDYEGDEGPTHWGELDPAYEICAKGRDQSPINLTGFIEAELEPITFNYTGLVTELVNNGHTIQANYTAGSTMSVAGKTFELKQFHFHAPSENAIDGKQFPLEAHFVHQAEDGSLAVIGVLFEIGEANEGIEKLWAQMPAEVGAKAAMAARVRAGDLLPEERDYYRYNGSLTTPPCSEGVFWLMMKKTMTVSAEQVEKFAHTMHHPNNRPLQPIGARPVLK